jgi:O-antigen/teichoic acid export membrane protein
VPPSIERPETSASVESEKGGGLARTASHAALWTAIGKYSSNLVTLVVMAVLSRLLTPADFGLVAMVAVVSGFVAVLADAGMASAVIQQRELDQRGLSSVFWLGLGLGLLSSALMAGAGPFAARFFGEPVLAMLFAALGAGFLLTAAAKVPTGLLERSLRFREITQSDVVSSMLSAIVGVASALGGLGYWALVLQSLTSNLCGLLLRFWLSGWRPSFAFDLSTVRKVSSYSGGITAFNSINYWARNLDKFLIGKALGSASLGYYHRAYALMLYPIDTINGIINPVLHPLLATLQKDVARLRRVYLKLVKLVAYIALPFMAVMALTAPEAVLVIWGPQWTHSTEVFEILCVVGGVQPISATFGAVFLALNRTKLLAVVGAVNAAIIMAGIALGLPYGLEGVATGYSIAFGLVFLPTLYIVFVRLLDATFGEIAATFVRPLLTAGTVVMLLVPLNMMLRGRAPQVVHLITAVLVALVLLGLCFALLDSEFFDEVLALFSPKLQDVVARIRRRARG